MTKKIDMKKKSPLVWTTLTIVALIAGGAWAAKSGVGAEGEEVDRITPVRNTADT